MTNEELSRKIAAYFEPEPKGIESFEDPHAGRFSTGAL